MFKTNVGTPERWVSVAAGGALLYFALRRRSWAGSLLALGGGKLLLRGALGRSLVYKALGISTAAQGIPHGVKGTVKVDKTVTVDRPAEEIYRFWRNFENLPRIMDHLKAVRT